MRWRIALLAIAACGGRPPAEERPGGPPRTARPEQPPPVEPERKLTTSPADLRIRWAELGIHGDNWQDKVATFPEHLRWRMALQLLEDGNFDCDAELPVGCESGARLRIPTKDSGIQDACLRRVLAIWALDQLTDDQLYERHDLMADLVKIPPPEQALTHAVLKRFKGFAAATLHWEAKSVGHKDLPPFDLHNELDHDELVRAAEDLHLDAAVLALDPRKDTLIVIDAIRDGYLMTSTRLEVLDRVMAIHERLSDELRTELGGALWQIKRSHDCTLSTAGTAAEAELEGGPITPPSGPYKDEDALISATCASLAMDVRGKPWKQLVTKHGLAVTNKREDAFRVDALWTKYPFAYDDDLDGVPDVPEADPDGDGNAANTVETTTRHWGKSFTLPYADELKLALPNCDGNVCKVPDSTVWFELDIQQERGTKLRLRGISRHEKVGSDC